MTCTNACTESFSVGMAWRMTISLCDTLGRLDDDGGSVGEHFRHALHDFVGIVAHTDDGISAHFGGVLEHQFEGFVASLFAKIGKGCNIAADDGVERSAEGS